MKVEDILLMGGLFTLYKPNGRVKSRIYKCINEKKKENSNLNPIYFSLN